MKDKPIKEIINLKDNEDKKSNSSVLNLSLDSTKERSKDTLTTDYIYELKKELMDEVNLPIENEFE